MSFIKLIYIGICFSALIVQCYSSEAPIDRKLENLLNSFKLPKQNKNCGISNTKPNLEDLRIVNGVNAVPNSWPWIVSIQSYSKDSKKFDHTCGGSIIYSKLILTAAHCVGSAVETPNNTLIVVGFTDLAQAKSSDKYQVEKIYFNSNYKDSANSNDIAVILLKRPIKFSAKIRPICLPDSIKDSDKVIGKTLVVVGW